MQVQGQHSGPIPLLVGIATPLALLALAYALWAISDRLLVIGPLDRAAFGWIVVLPVSWLAPGMAGLAWSRLLSRTRVAAALVVGGAIAVVSGVLLANAIDFVACRPVTSWTDDLPGSLAIGAVIGAGQAMGALMAASVASRPTGIQRTLAAVATGAIIGLVGLFAAIMTYAFFFPVASCAAVPG